jgi:signal transduction histidine kinase
VLQGELPGKGRDGAAYWERVVIACPRDGGSAPENLLVVSQDITEIRQYAEEARQLQKMDAVGRLAGGIAHDFNNIITIVRGYSDLLLDQLRQDDPARLPAQEIYKASERASQLVRQLLAFSRKQTVQLTPLNLNTVVRSADSLLSRLLGEDIRVETALDPDLRLVLADHGQMEQILVNLAVNARDAMPAGGTLKIATRNITVDPAAPSKAPHPFLAPGDYVELTVADDGLGIPPEVLPHIFEPFFTTKSPGKGTGLGLSTVYGIVQRCRGHIRAESPQGRGAVFTIWLPAQPSAPNGGPAEMSEVLLSHLHSTP